MRIIYILKILILLIFIGDDITATVGLDKGQTVPVLHGVGAESAAQDAERARELAEEAALHPTSSDDIHMEEDGEVSIVVVDGIVMSPTVCLIFLITV